jgi:cytochrome c oxidase assembly factor CtaG
MAMLPDAGLSFWLTQWNWQPTIILGTIIILGLYIYAVGPLRAKHQLGPVIRTGQAVCFFIGVYCIFFALSSPLDELGDNYLFSAHMVQHLVLTIVGPPLMIAGMPAWLFEPLLRNKVILRIGRILTYPGFVFILFNANFWLWHAPPLYDRTLYDPYLHQLEHLTYLITGFLYWWPVFSPLSHGWPRLSMGGQLIYIFLGGMPTILLGAGLTFTSPLYEPYIHAPRVWGISPATDQQLGGLIMWVPANIAYIIVASIFFIRWMMMQDEKQRAEEALLYGDADEANEENEELPHSSSQNNGTDIAQHFS